MTKLFTTTAVTALLLSACAQSADKPIDTPELRQAAAPGIKSYIARVVAGATAVKAEPFSEGHMHETWKVTATVGEKTNAYAFKLFHEAKFAELDSRNYELARRFGWPVPADVHRGKATPYKDLPAALQEFIPGDSLARAVTARWNAGKNTPADIAPMYGSLGAVLGEVHKKAVRPRKPGDISGAAQLLDLADLCQQFLWCGPHTQTTFKDIAKTIDGVEVTFVHGDLYETQVIMTPDGKLSKFLDLDEAGHGDPALDVGYVLAHVLLINPLSRQALWGIPNPGPEEQKATAEAFLSEYRKATGLDGPDWAMFLDRAKAYMRLRVGRLMIKYHNNVHAKPLLDLVDKKKVMLFVMDPLADLGVQA